MELVAKAAGSSSGRSRSCPLAAGPREVVAGHRLVLCLGRETGGSEPANRAGGQVLNVRPI